MADMNGYDYSDDGERDQLAKIAQTTFSLSFDSPPMLESSRNMIGLRSTSVLCSRRLDSRTYFAQDLRYGLEKKAGVFRGDKATQVKIARRILEEIGIPTDEIHNEVVMTERLGVARLDHKTGTVHPEEVQEGRPIISVSRRVGGVPVWSSNLLLGLTAEKRVGFLQLHWPELPGHEMKEAQRLAFKVKNGWRPPEHRGAKTETVEAGIVHLPAVGFFMDIHAAIRVIYAPEDVRYGRKVMLYLNRHGQVVPLRPTVEAEMKTKVERKGGTRMA